MKNREYDLYTLPQIRDLKDLLSQKNTKQPDAIAYTYYNANKVEEKTYKQFHEDVMTLGTWIYEQGYHHNHIAIVGENSYEWLVCFFAIVCGGNVAVPIDKDLPENEIANLLTKADVNAVFSSDGYRKSTAKAIEISKNDIRLYKMSELQEYINLGRDYIAIGNNTFQTNKIDSSALCCIMFTSGTEGSSKGVMLSHGNLAADINSSCQLFVLEGNTIAVLPFHHAFGLVVAVFMVLNYGYTIHINKSLKRIKRDIEYAKPQTMFLVPLFVETFHKQIWATAQKEGKFKMLSWMMKLSDLLLILGIDVRKKLFRSVREAFGGENEYIICGGAPLNSRYISEFRSWGIEILNGYGTTECSPCAAVNRNLYHRDGTIGLAVPGIDVKLDDGQLMIKGPIVMQGYYKDSTSTDAVLRDGWYATGDLGNIDEDGFITLTGRCKNLIILSNGENVSPEELEADFLKYEEVQEVVVYEQNGIIVAEIFPTEKYLEGASNSMDTMEYFNQMRKTVNQGRPMYKQIGEIILRDTEFPKNSSKKILRKREN